MYIPNNAFVPSRNGMYT